MRHFIRIAPLALGLALAAAPLGCRDEGPGERLGRALDEAAGDIREAVEAEVEDAREAAEQAASEAAERIRKETDAAAEKAHEAIDDAVDRTRS